MSSFIGFFSIFSEYPQCFKKNIIEIKRSFFLFLTTFNKSLRNCKTLNF